MSQDADQDFVELVRFAPCGEGGTQSTLVTGEAAFGLGAMTIPPVGKAVVHHPAIAPLGRPESVSRIERDDRAANAEFLAAERVIVLCIATLVAQQPPRSKVRRCLPDGGGEVRRVLAGTSSGDGADDQLRIRVKHGRELWPGRVRRLSATAPTLEVHRRMSRLQAGRVDRRRAVLIVDDQTASASVIAAGGRQFFKPPFSRSFCSTRQSVE